MRIAVACVILALSWSTGKAEERIFTDVKGRKLIGEITAVNGNRVEMMVNGKRFIFPVETLIDDDQAFIQEWARNNENYNIDIRIDSVEDPNKRKRDSQKRTKNFSAAWRYNATINNRSGSDLKDLRVDYNVIIRKTDKKKERTVTGRQKDESYSSRTGSFRINRIDDSKRATFATEWIDTFENSWQKEKTGSFRDANGDISVVTYWDDYSSETELDGLWVKIYLGDRVITDWKSDGKMIKEAKWNTPTPAPPLAAAANKPAAPANKPAPDSSGKPEPRMEEKPDKPNLNSARELSRKLAEARAAWGEAIENNAPEEELERHEAEYQKLLKQYKESFK